MRGQLDAYRMEDVPGCGSIPVGRWDSLEAWARDARDRETAPGSENGSRDYSATPEWDNGDGFDGVQARVELGWPEMAERIRQMAMPVASKVASMIELPTYDFTDDGSLASDFDVATALTGEPSYWLKCTPEYRNMAGRILRIGCMINGNARDSADEFMRRGVAGAALVLCLEAAGYSVELRGYTCNRDRGYEPETIQCVTLKRAGEHLELNRIAMGLAHAGTHRRIGWACREADERVPREIRSGGYGCSREIPEAFQASEGIDVMIPYAAMGWNEPAIVAWVLGQLTKRGVTLK